MIAFKPIKMFAAALCAAATLAGAAAGQADNLPNFRPPAVPLVTSDPYLSVWSEANRLTDDTTRHWTHREHSLISLIRIDGKCYRLMGKDPAGMPALPQTGVQVLPTRSIYEFENAEVHVTLTFMTPALPNDLDILARPITYLTWDVRAVDGRKHGVTIYDSASSQLAVNTPGQSVTWNREKMGDLTALRVGSADQGYLATPGDDTRIDWGYAYLVAKAPDAGAAAGASKTLTAQFASTGALPAKDDRRMPRAVQDDEPVLAVAFNAGSVGTESVSRHAMIGYDEVYAIKYYGTRLCPYWRRAGMTPALLFNTAEKEYDELKDRCQQFDRELMSDAARVGGAKYADICALAYRQSLAGCGLAADAKGQPLYFTKENTSNGDIATVDVIFPMEPILLLLSPTLTKASLVSNLEYAVSPRWKFPNAPHDLGTYPVVTGRDDGGEGMPVEESGNMLILCDALSQSEGSAQFASHWWPVLTKWEQYLEKYGNDPEEQLCTDDFMGHLAHNANLSVKAILGIAAYGDMCRMRGDQKNADRLRELARTYARHWMQVAGEDGHSRLAFDKPNTWSQKYNLVWDRILGLDIFPASVAQQEIAYYKTVMQPFGVPLDSRTRLTKTDWSLWIATMADKQTDFENFIAPIYSYLNQTTARIPFVDSYITDNAASDGMHARPVIGGVFIKMLSDRAIWAKWSGRDRARVGPWAPLPKPPIVTPVLATSQQTPQTWKYTTVKPAGDWTAPGFDDSRWKQGLAGFGTNPPGSISRTNWSTPDIWIRRELTMPAGSWPSLQWWVYHDEDIEIYVDGILAGHEASFQASYVPLEITAPALARLKPGARIVIAAHCHQTEGGQNIDIGLANVVQPK